MIEMKRAKCPYCGETYEDIVEGIDICIECENEYAEFIDSKGWVVGEFDCFSHPDYVPDAFKGTKWDLDKK
jgi:hypothetical protein